MLDLDNLISVLKNVVVKNRVPFSLHEPCLAGNEWKYLKDCLDTGWVSSVGKYVDKFEKALAEFTGAKYAVAVVNGTAALHICLKLVGVSPGDEVLAPALTFVATANAITYCGALPHFVDSEEKTLGLDPRKLVDYLKDIAAVTDAGCFNRQTGRRIKAVVPVHTFGHPVDMEPLLELCQSYKLDLVEDAAESLGSLYKGRHTGTFGFVSALSFNGNKIATTGGGGAILTNDQEQAGFARHLTTTAKLPHRWAFVHDTVGHNYRMPNINAALGYAQLEQLPDFLKRKRSLAEKYYEAFRDFEGIKVFKEAPFARSNYWLNVLLLDENYVHLRDNLLVLTNDQGIVTRPAWTLMSKLSMYKGCPKMNLEVAESLERRLINIPSSAGVA